MDFNNIVLFAIGTTVVYPRVSVLNTEYISVSGKRYYARSLISQI